ncbi:CPBP family intramembrane glutamic endopeptidase [Polaribacter uvawellassae]|uniref:CPBP family intramembrane glutamic endopeptidase n=1 Tax=Polaribacter uvawellassae TaxID=3133495 RepID=UPI00321B256E
MLGLLVIIVVSWLLLHFIEKKNIAVLGIIPNRKRTTQFFIGFVFTILLCLLTIYIETLVLSVKWQLNSVIHYQTILNALVYHLRSALTEDLVFRGAILYILIRKVGIQKAILISALCFGIYHVFSYGMLGGRIISILYVILITGFTGYVWAYTFAKTNSILMPLGFHLGWNLLLAFFMQSQPYGELLFTETSRIQLSEWNGLYFSLFKGLFPSFITFIFVKQYLRYNVKLKD